MPKNTKKRQFVNRTNTWTCAVCLKDIKTTGNQKLADTKIRLHKASCLKRTGKTADGQTDVYTKRFDEMGGGYNVNPLSDYMDKSQVV